MWKSVTERGGWQGEIWDRRKNGEIYPKWLSISSVVDGEGKVSRYIGLFSDISVMKQTQDQLYHMANYDSLTGLANRRFFQDRLESNLKESQRSGVMMGVMFIDLDGFKLINDNLGHRAGDQLLRAVADRLKDCVRDSDTVSRMGGDEFTIILSFLKNLQGAALVAQKILQKISDPVTLEQNEIIVSASIGISLYPEDSTDVESLLQNADTALYEAKEQGKNIFRFYSRDMNTRAAERLSMQMKLRKAIEGNELYVHYQPQVDAGSGRLTGVEALVRWNSPEMGRVPPDEFIPLAEETGLIHKIGEFVLREACAQGAGWMAEGLEPILIGVNISGSQLRRPDFNETIEKIVLASGLPANQLEFELTESVLVEDIPETMEKLNRLKAMGASIAIDDFGTKYSSLSYLKRLPINRIKIDKSFVMGIHSDAAGSEIALAILSMSKSLNFKVVAEGVEQDWQAELLRQKGCDFFQGNYYSKPIPFGELRTFRERMAKKGGQVDRIQA